MRVLKKEYWPYTVTLKMPVDVKKIDEWLKESVGKRFKDYYSYSQSHGDVTYGFKDEEILLVFKLKWKQR